MRETVGVDFDGRERDVLKLCLPLMRGARTYDICLQIYYFCAS